MESEDQGTERYRAPALDKGLDILEFLADQPAALTRAEIVRAIGRSPSEIYRMLERLVARGYVHRSAGGDRYALTLKLFMLGAALPPLRRLAAMAQPRLDGFAAQTAQSVHLVAPDLGRCVVLAHASGPANWEYRLRIGAQLDLTTTGSGKTLLAFQAPERLHETLRRWGHDPADAAVARLGAELARIRDQGYRSHDSAQLDGVHDISAPVMDAAGEAFAVVTCPYIRRVDKATPDIPTTLAALRALAAELSLT